MVTGCHLYELQIFTVLQLQAVTFWQLQTIILWQLQTFTVLQLQAVTYDSNRLLQTVTVWHSVNLSVCAYDIN